MKYELLTSLLSIIGTLLGSMFGVVTSAKLTNFRIESLEKKVDKHNNFAERVPVIENSIKNIYHKIDDIEKEFNK